MEIQQINEVYVQLNNAEIEIFFEFAIKFMNIYIICYLDIYLTKLNGGKYMVNAILAGILSFFIPGLGQALAGDIQKGIIFFVIAIVLGAVATLIFRSWVVNIIQILYALFAAYDAYQMAQ